MAQTTVTKFYNTRKRDIIGARDFKLHHKLTAEIQDSSTNLNAEKSTRNEQVFKTINIKDSEVSQKKEMGVIASKCHKSAPTKASSKPPKPVKGEKKSKSKQTTVTSFYASKNLDVCETRDELTTEAKTCAVKPKKESKAKKPVCRKKKTVDQADALLGHLESNSEKTTVLKKLDSGTNVEKTHVFLSPVKQSPKRNLPMPNEASPSKKKPLAKDCDVVLGENVALEIVSTPTKSKEESVRRKLELEAFVNKTRAHIISVSPVKNTSPVKNISALLDKGKLKASSDQSKPKLNLLSRFDELKKSLESFSGKVSNLEKYESNPYKITAVISPSEPSVKTSSRPSVPACQRFNYLASSEALVLPLKYKVLSEMFRSMDTVVSMLHNRKEKITFGKVSEGVQKIMKRTFTKTHLGQMVTVFPNAYILTLEKCNFISKKTDGSDYQLVISPDLTVDEDGNKPKPGAFVSMTSACLIERRNTFTQNLIRLVQKYHQDFLKRLHVPPVPDEQLKRWHPQFPVDSVADIKPAPIPESPDSKIYTAKDVLNKVKGSFNKKIEKALLSVAEESSNLNVTLDLKDVSTPKPETTKNALKGISTDLLEKIRARESAKLLETMTRPPEETKRLAMLERLPKIVHILWHYFIAERKAAVPVDTAVEKIIHSFNSLMTPDDVKEHLKLITETFQGWLSFIEIRKGVYIRMDKKMNINEMLDNFKH